MTDPIRIQLSGESTITEDRLFIVITPAIARQIVAMAHKTANEMGGDAVRAEMTQHQSTAQDGDEEAASELDHLRSMQADREVNISNLRELMEKATPGKWTYSVSSSGSYVEPAGVWIGQSTLRPNTQPAAHAALIVAAINALPALLAVVEAAKARMETYDKGEDYTGGIRAQEWDNLRAALAKLDDA